MEANKVEAKRCGAIFVSSSGAGGRQRNLLCAKRNLRGVLCAAAKERYNWLSLIMNAEIPLWVLGSVGSPPSKRLSVLQIMFLVVVNEVVALAVQGGFVGQHGGL